VVVTSSIATDRSAARVGSGASTLWWPATRPGANSRSPATWDRRMPTEN